MLQYAAMNFFSPITICGHIEKPNSVNVYVSADVNTVKHKATINYYKWGNVKPVGTVSFDVVVVSVYPFAKQNISRTL